MGAPKNLSFLPEDLEQKLKDIENHILSLNRQKTDLEICISDRKSELLSLTKEKENAIVELTRVTEVYEGKNKAMDSRELILNNREIYLNTLEKNLEKKENQVDKYLAIFHNMKNVLKSD